MSQNNRETPLFTFKREGSGKLKLLDESPSDMFFVCCLSHPLECQIQTAGTLGVLFTALLSVPLTGADTVDVQ